LDANFHSTLDDVSLLKDWGYHVNIEDYEKHMVKQVNEAEVRRISLCLLHRSRPLTAPRLTHVTQTYMPSKTLTGRFAATLFQGLVRADVRDTL
jgi:hypothetical protein